MKDASYLMLEARNPTALGEKCNKYIKQGYVPSGSLVACMIDSHGLMLIQPMVRYVKPMPEGTITDITTQTRPCKYEGYISQDQWDKAVLMGSLSLQLELEEYEDFPVEGRTITLHGVYWAEIEKLNGEGL